MRKLNVGPKSEILRITRINLTSERLVYVLVANKQFSYTHGKSLIVYIGTTRKGIKRIAESAAHHADDILGRHGITEVSARVITFKGRKHVKRGLNVRCFCLSVRSMEKFQNLIRAAKRFRRRMSSNILATLQFEISLRSFKWF